MVRFKLFILPILCSVLFLQSCVHGTLDECPPMVRYAVAFKYTNHTGTGDRFSSDVKKINIYVFDENGLAYTTTTKDSPFDKNFNIPLDLPIGKYHIIAWGNALEDGDYAIDPEFQIGQTTFDEARLYLNNVINGVSDKDLEKLFYGELPDVEIPLYLNRVDTMSLTNNTNNVRVVIKYDLKTGMIPGVDLPADLTKVKVSLTANNIQYDFSNKALTPGITYNPYQYFYNDDILNTDNNKWITMYYYSDSVQQVTNTSVYDFKTLKMTVGSPMMLNIIRSRGAGMAADPIMSVDLMKMFGIYFNNKGFVSSKKLQEQFDKNEYYRVDVYMTYQELVREFVSGDINIENWHKSESSVTPMN